MFLGERIPGQQNHHNEEINDIIEGLKIPNTTFGKGGEALQKSIKGANKLWKTQQQFYKETVQRTTEDYKWRLQHREDGMPATAVMIEGFKKHVYGQAAKKHLGLHELYKEALTSLEDEIRPIKSKEDLDRIYRYNPAGKIEKIRAIREAVFIVKDFEQAFTEKEIGSHQYTTVEDGETYTAKSILKQHAQLLGVDIGPLDKFAIALDEYSKAKLELQKANDDPGQNTNINVEEEIPNLIQNVKRGKENVYRKYRPMSPSERSEIDDKINAKIKQAIKEYKAQYSWWCTQQNIAENREWSIGLENV